MNKYKVPKKQWDRWNAHARRAFNCLYSDMIRSQRLLKHPKAPMLHYQQWRTVVWNAAWLAAEAANKTPIKGVVDEKGKVVPFRRAA